MVILVMLVRIGVTLPRPPEAPRERRVVVPILLTRAIRSRESRRVRDLNCSAMKYSTHV